MQAAILYPESRAASEGLYLQASLIMPRDKQRRQVVFEAARLLYARDESEIHRAKIRAARQVYGGDLRASDLPSNREVRDQIHQFARADQRELDREELGQMRGLPATEANDIPVERRIDRFHVYAMLLTPLEQIKEGRERHPEGDALYHSLQVFTLAREELPYDEEFLLAALLHDVGKAIDPGDHIGAALDGLEGFITPRTAWLIEHHDEALALLDQAIGARSLRRLQASDDFEELLLLARCDRAGRRRGVQTPDVEDALDYIRELAEMCGE
jgi:hypothetical protein